MLDRRSWWPAAEDLTVGQKKRVPHDCGEGRTLIVSRDANGYRAWCHRCNDGGGAEPPAESLADKVARLAALRAGDTQLAATAGLLPAPAERVIGRWPVEARLWLYKAGLSDADIGRLGVYYHPPSDRVILPVLDGSGDPVYWQGRAYQPGRMPKYLGPTPRPPRLLPVWGRADKPTLTEDILSAMKVGTVAEGWAVLGTKVSDHLLLALMRRGGCNVWLDPDAAGRRGAAKIIKQLRAYGVPCRDILSTRDPKLHTRDEIREILCST